MKKKLIIGLLLTAHVHAVVASNTEVVGGFTPSNSASMIEALRKSKAAAAAAALTEEKAALDRGSYRARAEIKSTTQQALLEGEYDAYVKKVNTYNSQQRALSVAYQENEDAKEDPNNQLSKILVETFLIEPMTKDEWMKSKGF